MSDIESDSVCKICDFCITKKLWISGVHIPGVSNEEADKGVMQRDCGLRLDPQFGMQSVAEKNLYLRLAFEKICAFPDFTREFLRPHG